MQNTLKSISHIALFFFIVFGGLHISASFLIVQGVTAQSDWYLFQVLDLPFLLAALVYASTRFSLMIENLTGKAKTALILCSIASAVIFLFALYLNFLVPDVQLPI